MTVRVIPGDRQKVVKHVLTELAAWQEREDITKPLFQSDICDWAERNFYIPITGNPIQLPLHQKAVLRYFFTRRSNRHFPFQTIVYSTVKKSGKSTTAGVIGRWFAETQGRMQEIMAIGNDLEQAKDRSFKEIVRSLELTPGYNQAKEMVPGRWILHKQSLRCLLTYSSIKAIAVDAKGEAGGQQALTIWTELWGAENVEAKRFWDEMTPIPTVPDSIRLVETYAGYDGESELLRGLYDVGKKGHQLTAGELAEFVCREGVPGESFEDYVLAWHETEGDPETLIPVWVNEQASLGMYWDSGLQARRMPWQHMYVPLPELPVICTLCRRPADEHDIGVTADQYYTAQEELLTPQAFRRLHLNEWVGAESEFVPMSSWDNCGNVHTRMEWPEIPLLTPKDRTPIILAADAAVTKDCFGVVAVSRCPHDDNCVDVRELKKWDPEANGGQIDLSKPEEFIRTVCQTHNVWQVTYDWYQMENSAQTFRKDGIAWLEKFSQAGDRLVADSQLYDMIVHNKVHFTHDPGCPQGSMCNCWVAPLREHIANSNKKMQKDEDSKMRIVKKAAGQKIDLCVCLSMAVARCLYLRMGKNG